MPFWQQWHLVEIVVDDLVETRWIQALGDSVQTGRNEACDCEFLVLRPFMRKEMLTWEWWHFRRCFRIAVVGAGGHAAVHSWRANDAYLPLPQWSRRP